MNDNDPKPFVIGERVRMRGQPWLQGTVWSIAPDEINVDWDDGEEVTSVRNAARLERLPQPANPPASAARLRPV